MTAVSRAGSSPHCQFTESLTEFTFYLSVHGWRPLVGPVLLVLDPAGCEEATGGRTRSDVRSAASAGVVIGS